MAEEAQRELEKEKENLEAHIDEVATAAGKEAQNKGLSPEEVQQRIQAARKEEKDKLYPQLEEVKNALKDVQQTLREEREEKERIKQQSEEEAERRRQAKLSDTEKTAEILRNIEEQLREERKAREASEARWETVERQRQLDTYKARALQAAGDEILVELVYGNNEAEIDASIERAKARYKEIADRLKAERSVSVRRGLTSSNPDTAALEEQELSEQLTAVDQDKYLKDPVYRDKIKAELEREYAKAQGR